PATLAGDDVKAIAASPYHNWLNDAVRLNRSRQIIQPRVVDLSSRLKRVRHEAIDVNFERAEPRFGGIGNQRTEAFAESGAFVHKSLTAEIADYAETIVFSDTQSRRNAQKGFADPIGLCEVCVRCGCSFASRDDFRASFEQLARE